MSNFQRTIDEAAAQFAQSIIASLRGLSINDLMSITGGGSAAPRASAPAPAAAAPAKRGPGRPRKVAPAAAAPTPKAPKAAKVAKAPKAGRKPGRLQRRSANDIAATLDQIVGALKEHPQGLRAEELKNLLQLDKREMPKPIAAGLSSGTIEKAGEKRATRYFVKAVGGRKKR